MKTLKRRRKENKTDYANRLKLLKSEKPRIVFRKTNRYIIAQYVTSEDAQDKIEIGTNSKQLMKYGWPKEFAGSLKSISASYLTGFLIGKKIIHEKSQKAEPLAGSSKIQTKETPIVDIGMIRNLHGSKVFGFLKGLKDSGVKIKCDEKFFPSKEKIEIKKIPFEKIKAKIGEEK